MHGGIAGKFSQKCAQAQRAVRAAGSDRNGRTRDRLGRGSIKQGVTA